MTVVQRQCLLAALGLYPTWDIDGIWGNKSQLAMDKFKDQYRGMTLTEVVSYFQDGSFWEDITYWNREEFRCHCGGKHCDGFPAEPDESLVRLLDDVRRYWGAPAICSSGVRCKQHNADVGGVENSKHLSGKAADFMVMGVSGKNLLESLEGYSYVNYAYIIGDGPYVHVDVI